MEIKEEIEKAKSRLREIRACRKREGGAFSEYSEQEIAALENQTIGQLQMLTHLLKK